MKIFVIWKECCHAASESNSHTFRISTSSKFLWANQALVTAESFSRRAPKYCGLSDMTTTAFCTVDRVTSAERLISNAALSCRVHEIPNSDVAADFSVAARRNVK